MRGVREGRQASLLRHVFFGVSPRCESNNAKYPLPIATSRILFSPVCAPQVRQTPTREMELCILHCRCTCLDKHKSFAIQSLTHGLQSVAKGDKEAARKAVAAMKSISSRGGAKKGQQLSPPRNEQEAEVSSPTAQQTSSNDGVVIVRSGRRYFVKQKVTVVSCTVYSFCHSHGFSVFAADYTWQVRYAGRGDPSISCSDE